MKFTKNLVYYRYLCCLTRYFLILVLSSLALLAVGALMPRKWSSYLKNNCDLEVCVADRGIHSDIIVATKTPIFDWHKYISVQAIGTDAANDYKYLSFGWGDRDFYMLTPSLAEMKFSTTFKALFLPTPSVMHVQGYQLRPDYFHIKCIRVNQADYLKLMQFIQASFQLDTKGDKIRLGNGHSTNAGFYQAMGSYSLLRNCNSWTAEGLRTADINTPVWDGLSLGIMLHLKSNCGE
ncbi:DUF2459 domain-containing protein [Fortiea contorta]|uniref:DUF2459 domain-containing protein n=1 Tax=Fortiea contorta TaxID=1892405 RepID=UPI0003496137|nr:DUF2459 domain-containing protein [Fortiea contorta]